MENCEWIMGNNRVPYTHTTVVNSALSIVHSSFSPGADPAQSCRRAKFCIVHCPFFILSAPRYAGGCLRIRMRSMRQRSRGSVVVSDNAAPLSYPGRIRRILIRSSDSRRLSPCCAARMGPARPATLYRCAPALFALSYRFALKPAISWNMGYGRRGGTFPFRTSASSMFSVAMTTNRYQIRSITLSSFEK